MKSSWECFNAHLVVIRRACSMPNKYWIHIRKQNVPSDLWRSAIFGIDHPYGGEMRGGNAFFSIEFSHSYETSRKSQKLHNLVLDALRTEMRSIKIQCYNTKEKKRKKRGYRL